MLMEPRFYLVDLCLCRGAVPNPCCPSDPSPWPGHTDVNSSKKVGDHRSTGLLVRDECEFVDI